MSTPPLSRRTVLRGTMAAGVAAAFAPLAVRPVFAEVAASATNGYLVYFWANHVYRANADGTGMRTTVADFAATHSNVASTVDGSRFAYVNSGSGSFNDRGIWTKRFDGSNPVHLTLGADDLDLAFSAAGRFVYFSRLGKINAVTADGAWLRTDIISYPEPNQYYDRHPNIVTGKNLIFERRISLSSPAIYEYQSATSATLLIANAKQGAYSPDGKKIAYVTSDGTYASLQLWVADANGTNGARLSTFTNVEAPSWAPDGLSIYVTWLGGPSGPELLRIRLDGTYTPMGAGANASVQPVTSDQNHIVRTWGQLALDTAIAISRFNWANHNATTNPDEEFRFKATAVVIGRGDQFYDALAGSALAANKGAPLLITPPNALYAPARAELQRVLAPGGKVYLLGGPVAISAAIEQEVKNLGYSVTRCGGFDMFDTAVKINQQITGPGVQPEIIIIATGAEFYDALAAGAAAGAYENAVVVLTDGDNMPAFSANYLNSINPIGKLIVTAGGPGDRALENALERGQLSNWENPDWEWWFLVGFDAIETALFLAEFMFSGPQVAAVATAAGWYDALTGGAMVGNNYGPLLLTPPGNLDPRVALYLNNNSSNLSYAVVLGGTAALPAARVPQIGANIGVDNRYIYDEVTPTSTASATSRSAGVGRVKLKAEQIITRAAAARSATAQQRETVQISPQAQSKRWKG